MPNILFHVEYHTLLYILSEVSHAFGVSSPVSHLLLILISYLTLFHLLLPCSNFGNWDQPLSPNACDTSDNIFITRCDTPHRTIYSAWLVRLNLKVSVIREMNIRESTYRQDEFTRKYTSFQLSCMTQEMMGLTNKLGVTSEIKRMQGLTFWINWGVSSD
jgi:hypothetical protein